MENEIKDILDIDENNPITKMFLRLPFAFDWVYFKGEQVFASINYDRTVKARKPMIDISYCATQALNNIVLYTVQYDKNKFKTL